jgi:hypothetical protein
MQLNGYFHAAGCDSESDSFVIESLSMLSNSYIHATYYAAKQLLINFVDEKHSLERNTV